MGFGGMRLLVSLNYSILGKLIELASNTVFGQLKVAIPVCWLAQASTLTDTHTQSMVFGEN